MREFKGQRGGGAATDSGGGGGEDGLRLKLARDRRAVMRRAQKQASPEGEAENDDGAESAGGDAGADQVVAIPEALKLKMEVQLGADFSAVNIHVGAQAEKQAEAMGAEAFTQGADVYFGKGAWNPDSPETAELLAHELVHVVQQGAAAKKEDKGPDAEDAPKESPSTNAPQTKLSVSEPGDAAEVEADQIASRVAGGGGARPQAAATADVHRSAAGTAAAPKGKQEPGTGKRAQGPEGVAGSLSRGR